MWLREVIVDGFKSYAQRTVIGPLDSRFTAITGLNGSGKSNVLDAICFVLGISSLQQVRVAQLSELVYKSGASGVTAASVSLVFDNSDAGSSPVGYSEYSELTVSRSVVLGGKSRFLINGCTATAQRVMNLFHSVGLNVNNPHFLIMQGRITRVISMRPPELLSLIEEAAGTRMFESKKAAAVRTMQRKQSKVQEIDSVLQQEIAPQLRQLKDDQALLALFQQRKQQLQHWQRLHIAFQYSQQLSSSRQAAEQSGSQSLLCTDKQREIDQLAQTMSSLDRDSEAATSSSGGNGRKGGEGEGSQSLSVLELAASEASKRLVSSTAGWQNASEAAESERSQQSAQSLQLAQLVQEQQGLRQLSSSLQEQRDQAEARLAAGQAELAGLRSRELGVGLEATEAAASEGGGGLRGQLMGAQRLLSQLDSELGVQRLRREQLQQDVSSCQARQRAARQQQAAFMQTQREAETAEAEVGRLQAQLRSSPADAAGRAALESSASALQEAVDALRLQLSASAARLSRFQFSFSLPASASFDRSAVKGTVVSLLRLRRPDACRALDAAAAGRLLNVVVETEQVARELLQSARLTRRWTLIPLNRIASAASAIPAAVSARAQQQEGAGSVCLALDCLDCSEDSRPALRFVFGSSLVCASAAVASRLAFSPAVGRRCVTLDGDVVDPRGSMEGGAVSAGSSSLVQLFAAHRELEAAARDREEKLAEAQQRLEAAAHSASLTAALSSAQHRLSLLRTALSNCEWSQLESQRQESEARLQELKAEEGASEQARAAAQSACRSLEAELQRLSTAEGRAAARSRLQQQMADTTAAVASLKQAAATAARQHEQLQARAACVQRDLEAGQAAVEQSAAALQHLTAQLEAATERVAADKLQYDAAVARVSQREAALSAESAGAEQLRRSRQAAAGERRRCELELKRLQAAAQKLQAAEAEGQRRLQRMRSEHSWIAREEGQFGRAGGEFDFAPFAASAASVSAFSALQAEVAALSRQVNRRAGSAGADAAEGEYAALTAKRDIVQADKAKIEQVIAQLEARRQQAVHDTWTRVNADFGAIMRSLLPGVDACLQPVSAQLQDGVEMRVGFGGVWKESLSELSGGQRSLLALSLILSLLLFRPAPIYILDEIDAALDLSHTQSIGLMLRQHFPHSQFLIVSLKEGMFSNANVLFRTHFTHGVSAVSRTQRAAAAGEDGGSAIGNQHDSVPAVGRRRGGGGGGGGGKGRGRQREQQQLRSTDGNKENEPDDGGD